MTFPPHIILEATVYLVNHENSRCAIQISQIEDNLNYLTSSEGHAFLLKSAIATASALSGRTGWRAMLESEIKDFLKNKETPDESNESSPVNK